MHWSDHSYVWHYNSEGHPSWLTDDQAFAVVHQAAKDWKACGIELRYAGITDKKPGVFDGKNVVGWRTDGTRYSAWTSWRMRRDGRAVEADITLYSNIFDIYRRKGIDAYLEMRKSAIHEFGHALGLSHSSKPSDAMSVRVRTRPEWRLPSDNDIGECRKIYSRPPL